jgi:cytochrome P450
VTELYNPLDPEIRRNPYPTYAKLREAGPVLRNELLSMWMFPRHQEVNRLLKDPRLASDRSEAILQRTPGYDPSAANPLRDMLSHWILLLDPPDHARLRGLVNKAFTPRFVRELRPRIETLCEELLAPAQASGSLDVLRDLANPLPFEVIAAMLGIPSGERASLREWSDGLAKMLGSLRPTADQGAEARRCVVELGRYLGKTIEARHGDRRDDLISELVAAEEEGGRLSAQEVLATCALLFLAGHETTTNLIGNGVLALTQHPDALAALRADPGLLEGAIEELLRFDSPVQFVTRVARERFEVEGVELEAGQPALLMIGSANRDPEAFTDPDRLDVTRQQVKHLSFGRGPHFCLGASLARLEADVVFRQLLDRFPRWELGLDVQDLDWRPDLGFRGVRSLPMKVS